jgi:hypothetical protein
VLDKAEAPENLSRLLGSQLWRLKVLVNLAFLILKLKQMPIKKNMGFKNQIAMPVLVQRGQKEKEKEKGKGSADIPDPNQDHLESRAEAIEAPIIEAPILPEREPIQEKTIKKR